jgi:hypothetical protein
VAKLGARFPGANFVLLDQSPSVRFVRTAVRPFVFCPEAKAGSQQPFVLIVTPKTCKDLKIV